MKVKAYKTVRDITVCNDKITTAEKIGILSLVKHELLEEGLREILEADENGS